MQLLSILVHYVLFCFSHSFLKEKIQQVHTCKLSLTSTDFLILGLFTK